MDFLGKHIGNTSLSHQGPLSHGVARRRRNVVVNGFDLGEALMEDEKLPETGRVDDEFWEIMSIAGVLMSWGLVSHHQNKYLLEMKYPLFTFLVG